MVVPLRVSLSLSLSLPTKVELSNFKRPWTDLFVSEFFPEVYKTNCSKCSEEQKVMLKKTIKAFHSTQKADWDKIVDKYDPKHDHDKDFLKWVMSSEKL